MVYDTCWLDHPDLTLLLYQQLQRRVPASRSLVCSNPAHKNRRNIGNIMSSVDGFVEAKNVQQVKLVESCMIRTAYKQKLNWSIFKKSAANLNKYKTTITDFISKCVDDCVLKKLIQSLPDQKVRMNREFHSLLKSRSKTFKLGDPDRYRKSRYNLCKAIRDSKRQYQTKLDFQTNHMDACHLWQSLQDIMSYKAKSNRIAGNSTSFCDEFNAFYAGFEQKGSETISPITSALDAPVPMVTATDIRSAFLRVNPQKATDPGGVPGHSFRSCADQLLEVFTDIFNLSLLHSEAPTCFKKTTIIPIPKKNNAAFLNGYHPVAMTSIITNSLQSVRISSNTSSTIILNTGVLQGCILSSLPIHSHSVAKFHTNSIYKFADDTTIVGQISNNDKTEYREKTECLTARCKDNNLSIDINKMKELVIDFRKWSRGLAPVYINGAEVEMIENVKFLAVMITNDLSWSTHVNTTVKKAQQRINFHRR
eukprot:g41158.t1